MTQKQGFKYSDLELRQVGIEVLLEKLGYAETLRFLSQMSSGHGDYLQWREQMFGDANVEELFDKAKEHFEHSGKED